MEHVPGGSIASCLRKYGLFDEEVTKSFTGKILSGLEYLHASRRYPLCVYRRRQQSHLCPARVPSPWHAPGFRWVILSLPPSSLLFPSVPYSSSPVTYTSSGPVTLLLREYPCSGSISGQLTPFHLVLSTETVQLTNEFDFTDADQETSEEDMVSGTVILQGVFGL